MTLNNMDPHTRKVNLESSMLFLQQQHANTLKALHDEIENLQKRCTDLSFQLTLKTDTPSLEDFERLGREVATERRQAQQLEEKIHERDRKIEHLHKRLAAMKQHSDEVVRLAAQTKATLEHELAVKATENAALLNDLLAMKRQVAQYKEHRNAVTLYDAQRREAVGEMPQNVMSRSTAKHKPNVIVFAAPTSPHAATNPSDVVKSVASGYIHKPDVPMSDGRSMIVLPAPPAEHRSSMPRRAHLRSTPTTMSASAKDDTTRDRMQQRRSSMQALTSTPEQYVPDPTPFLRHSNERESSATYRQITERTVLPPISATTGTTVDFVELLPQSRGSRHSNHSHGSGVRRPDSDSTSPDIETLAVDKLASAVSHGRRTHHNKAN